jgi:hypothetical protein
MNLLTSEMVKQTKLWGKKILQDVMAKTMNREVSRYDLIAILLSLKTMFSEENWKKKELYWFFDTLLDATTFI